MLCQSSKVTIDAIVTEVHNGGRQPGRQPSPRQVPPAQGKALRLRGCGQSGSRMATPGYRVATAPPAWLRAGHAQGTGRPQPGTGHGQDGKRLANCQ